MAYTPYLVDPQSLINELDLALCQILRDREREREMQWRDHVMSPNQSRRYTSTLHCQDTLWTVQRKYRYQVAANLPVCYGLHWVLWGEKRG